MFALLSASPASIKQDVISFLFHVCIKTVSNAKTIHSPFIAENVNSSSLISTFMAGRILYLESFLHYPLKVTDIVFVD